MRQHLYPGSCKMTHTFLIAMLTIYLNAMIKILKLVIQFIIVRTWFNWNWANSMNLFYLTTNVCAVQQYGILFDFVMSIFFCTYFLVSRIGISHAIHVHGHAFQVIDMGTREEYFNGNSTFAKSTHLPVVKDTVTMGWRSFVKIRFRATNPGYWLMHCHLEFHHKVGMVLLLKVGNKTDVPPPPIEFPKCGNILAPVNDIS